MLYINNELQERENFDERYHSNRIDKKTEVFHKDIV